MYLPNVVLPMEFKISYSCYSYDFYCTRKAKTFWGKIVWRFNLDHGNIKLVFFLSADLYDF